MFLPYFVLLLFSTTLQNGSPFPFKNSIEWIKAPNNQVLLLNQIPAGIENGIHLFLCRIQIEGNTVPGKLQIDQGEIFCYVAYRGVERKSYDFEMLFTFPGSISWKIYKGSSSANMISSGDMDGERSYVCRVTVDGNLIPGRLSPDGGTCHVAHGGLEYSRSQGVEYLGKNFLGIALNTEIIS